MPGALGPQFGLCPEKFFASARQLTRESVSRLGGHRVSAGRGVDPIRIAWTWALAGRAATQGRMRDRRGEQRNRRVPP